MLSSTIAASVAVAPVYTHHPAQSSCCSTPGSCCGSAPAPKKAEKPACMTPASLLGELDLFAKRHIGPRPDEIPQMLATINPAYRNMGDLINATIPEQIRAKTSVEVGEPRGEQELLDDLQAMAKKNKMLKSFIGTGYNAAITPKVILRNVIENPAWYTPYTPYQAEVSQGRLEAMLVYQTLVSDLTGMDISTCSLLDEGTAAAEAMRMAVGNKKDGSKNPVFFISDTVHPQTIDVIKTRAEPLGVKIVVGDIKNCDFKREFGEKNFTGAILQYPDTFGSANADYSGIVKRIHESGGISIFAADLLALTIMKEPAAFGADVVIGNSGRLGCPVGFGGPHAAFLSTSEKLKRLMPGRLIGVSRDVSGKPALRMALQTREQHIRREKALSNICTATALMCQTSAFYAIYHGPEGLKNIAKAIKMKASALESGLREMGFNTGEAGKAGAFFDTVTVDMGSEEDAAEVHKIARQKAGMNFREAGRLVGVSLDETATVEDVEKILGVFAAAKGIRNPGALNAVEATPEVPKAIERKTPYLQHQVFQKYQSETGMMRYLRMLSNKDIGLDTAMIPLGSCTMKLNAASIMTPITWPEFANVHPFAPEDQVSGYLEMIHGLEKNLCAVTGFHACCLMPNSGAAGEYAGLMTIRAYHKSKGNGHRNVCLIPVSAHGTNPASASLAGMTTVVVACDPEGNIDVNDLRKKAEQHKDKLSCVMMTYPSTHGVYEETFKECAKIVHDFGGCVYMDGANMNAQVGLVKPVELGADVCHLNLHKTFAMPHGGGGPGVGPICANEKLAPFMPRHGQRNIGKRDAKSAGAVASAPYGNASVLPISWMYTYLLGSKGLKCATQAAILNANYMAARLKDHYPILFTGPEGQVAHEFIIDLRPFKRIGIEAEDVAKRLIDFGFHAPTMSFPVPGTLMIEPTESEPKEELDRFCDAMIAIKREIESVEAGRFDRTDNPLKNAPHTAEELSADEWKHRYPREVAAYPVRSLRGGSKYFAPVKRVDNAWGDLHLYTTLPRADN